MSVAGDQRPFVLDLLPEELTARCLEWGMPKYAATQILEWVHQRGVSDPAAMTNLARRHRARLAESMRFRRGTPVARQDATDGTRKLLLAWDLEVPEGAGGAEDAPAGDGMALPVLGGGAGAPDAIASARQTEAVMIPSGDRRTACLSSQVGCPVGCRFCASGLGGLEGNLSAGQIIEQALHLTALPEVGRLTNVVFMGMGEPLANFAAVTRAIRILNAPWGLGIGARRITISTVGLPAAIRRLVDFELPVTLALSLHAPNDELRRSLIPWAEHSTIEEFVDACDAYFRSTGREITLEYILLRRVNDRPEHARELAEVAGRLRANVNLIRYNEVAGLPFERPASDDVLRFQKILREHRRNAHIRASRGRDIAAACGQLRHQVRSGDGAPAARSAG